MSHCYYYFSAFFTCNKWEWEIEDENWRIQTKLLTYYYCCYYLKGKAVNCMEHKFCTCNRLVWELKVIISLQKHWHTRFLRDRLETLNNNRGVPLCYWLPVIINNLSPLQNLQTQLNDFFFTTNEWMQDSPYIYVL